MMEGGLCPRGPFQVLRVRPQPHLNDEENAAVQHRILTSSILTDCYVHVALWLNEDGRRGACTGHSCAVP